MGRDIVVQQEPTAHRSKLWPHAGNGLQQSSDNLSVESTIDCLSFRHELFVNNALFVKKNVIGVVLILDFCKRNILDLGDEFEVYCRI
jgi:hypothetical protein